MARRLSRDSHQAIRRSVERPQSGIRRTLLRNTAARARGSLSAEPSGVSSATAGAVAAIAGAAAHVAASIAAALFLICAPSAAADRPLAGAVPGHQHGRPLVLLGLGRHGRIAAAAHRLPGLIGELVLAAVETPAAYRARVASRLTRSDRFERGTRGSNGPGDGLRARHT